MENALTYKDFYHPEDPAGVEEMFAFHGTSSDDEPSQEPSTEQKES